MEVLFSMEFLENALKRAQYKAVKTVYAYFKTQNEKAKQKETYKKALELAKERGLNTALYDDCLKNWAEVEEDIRKIRQEIDIEKTADAETAAKLRYLISCLHWPLMLGKTLNSMLYAQHWLFDRQPEDEELQPVTLEWESSPLQEDYKKSWLDENLFTTSNRLVRAVVYEEDSPQDYNFQNLPFGKLVDKIQDLSIRWGEAARATGFEFDKPLNTRDIKNADDAERLFDDLDRRLEVTYNAAPEDLRDEYRKAIRRLVKEVWEYHEKQQTTHYTGNQSKTFFPSETISPNDKITNTLFDGELKLGECAMIAHTKTPKKSSIEPIMSKVEINYKAIEDCVSLVQQDWDAFTDYDRSIYNACVSLYLIGNKFVTPQTIYRAYCGKQTAMATPKNIERIINSIEKLRSTNIKINADDVVHSYNKNIKKWEIDTTLLEARRHNALSIHGKSASGYELLAAPPLFVFADAIGQVIRTPISIQATPVTKTEDAVKMQEYLKNRIAAMGGGKVKRVIRYKSIFDKIEWMGETEGSIRNKKAKIREQVRSILDYWVQENYIARYAENRHGKEFYSIEIFLPLSKAN